MDTLFYARQDPFVLQITIRVYNLLVARQSKLLPSLEVVLFLKSSDCLAIGLGLDVNTRLRTLLKVLPRSGLCAVLERTDIDLPPWQLRRP